jgi:hypothetical protein
MVPDSAITIGFGGSSIIFDLPAGASGAVSVTETDAEGIRSTSNTNLILLQTPHGSVQVATPAAGSAIEVDGTGFAPFRAPQFGGVRDALVIGKYPSCPGGPPRTPVGIFSDSTLTLRAPAEYCESPLMLLFTAPFDTARPRDCASAPASAAYNCVAMSVIAGTVDPYFYIASASPPPMTSVEPGAVIELRGSGFGRSGRADIGGMQVPSRWTDTAIAVTVPAGARTGVLHVRRSTGDPLGVGVGIYQVADTTETTGGRLGIADVQLAITTAGRVIDVRSDVSLTATLSVNGRPVSGAAMAVSVSPEGGSRGKVSSASGTTDTSGSFSVVLHVNGGVGTDIMAARDGIRVARERLLVRRAPQLSRGTLPFGLGQISVTLSGDPIGVVSALITIGLVLLAMLISVGVIGRGIVAMAIGGKMRHHWSGRPRARTG